MSNLEHTGAVELVGRVLDYRASALLEDFADGASRSHDATTLEILEPPHRNGARLSIYHDQPEPERSLWRLPGATLRFTIDEDLLGEGVQIFSGAARDVFVISTGGRDEPHAP